MTERNARRATALVLVVAALFVVFSCRRTVHQLWLWWSVNTAADAR